MPKTNASSTNASGGELIAWPLPDRLPGWPPGGLLYLGGRSRRAGRAQAWVVLSRLTGSIQVPFDHEENGVPASQHYPRRFGRFADAAFFNAMPDGPPGRRLPMRLVSVCPTPVSGARAFLPALFPGERDEWLVSTGWVTSTRGELTTGTDLFILI